MQIFRPPPATSKDCFTFRNARLEATQPQYKRRIFNQCSAFNLVPLFLLQSQRYCFRFEKLFGAAGEIFGRLRRLLIRIHYFYTISATKNITGKFSAGIPLMRIYDGTNRKIPHFFQNANIWWNEYIIVSGQLNGKKGKMCYFGPFFRHFWNDRISNGFSCLYTAGIASKRYSLTRR